MLIWPPQFPFSSIIAYNNFILFQNGSNLCITNEVKLLLENFLIYDDDDSTRKSTGTLCIVFIIVAQCSYGNTSCRGLLEAIVLL